MQRRVSEIVKNYPYIVYEENGEILAYAYATRWKVRQAYDHTIETSIYVKAGEHKKGIGSRLYIELLDRLKKLDLHCLLAGISLPNNASIHLHEKLGFRKNGVLKEVGYKFDKWIDVGYWSLLI